MEGYALIGIDLKTMVVEIIATVEDYNHSDINENGYLCVLSTREHAKKIWGTKLSSMKDAIGDR